MKVREVIKRIEADGWVLPVHTAEIMKPVVSPLLAVLLAEASSVLVIPNATPHQPHGFWLWFGGIAVLSPIVGFWIYRRQVTSKA